MSEQLEKAYRRWLARQRGKEAVFEKGSDGRLHPLNESLPCCERQSYINAMFRSNPAAVFGKHLRSVEHVANLEGVSPGTLGQYIKRMQKAEEAHHA